MKWVYGYYTYSTLQGLIIGTEKRQMLVLGIYSGKNTITWKAKLES